MATSPFGLSIPARAGRDTSPPPTLDDANHCHLQCLQEAVLVRLALNALHGVRAALEEIEKLAVLFCTTPTDRTCNRVHNLWQHSSITNALQKLLESVGHSGYIFLFLRKFVDNFLLFSTNDHCQHNDRGITSQIQIGTEAREDILTSQGLKQAGPSYSLVNQAFAVALKNVLDGYTCALDTLHASIKMRRSSDCGDKTSQNLPLLGTLASIVHPEITLVEVYLHTRELRNQIEAVGNICCLGNEEILLQISRGKCLNSSANVEFDYFPKGADLLTYLYVQLRDCDPVHRGLLKYLFSCSCEPYIAFIKEWICNGKVDDPHKEFIIEIMDDMPTSKEGLSRVENIHSPTFKERDNVCLPCFLDDLHDPLLRTGQQLQILSKLLDLCSNALHGTCSHDWDLMAQGLNSVSCLSSLVFSWKHIKRVLKDRETMYHVLLEKLGVFFTSSRMTSSERKHLVNDLDFVSPHLCWNASSSVLFSNKLNYSFIMHDQGVNFVMADHCDSDISSASNDPSHENDFMASCDSSFLDSSEDGSEFGDDVQFSGGTSGPPKFLTSSLLRLFANNEEQKNTSHAQMENCLHPVPESKKNYEKFDQPSLKGSHLENEKINIFGISSPATSVEDYRISSCWPLGGLLSNPFHTANKNSSEDHLLLDRYLMAGEDIDTWKTEDICFDHICTPVYQCFLGKTKHNPLSCVSLPRNGKPQLWNYPSCYNLNMNPMLGKTAWLYQHSRDNQNVNGWSLSYFNFTSVEDPYEAFLERSSTYNVIYQDERFGSGICSGDGGERIGECADETIRVDQTIQTVSDPPLSSGDSWHCLSDKNSVSVSGGSKWAGLLNYPSETTTTSDSSICSPRLSEIPLEVIIDSCISQGILLQYKYVSSFIIRLLEDGFGLHAHLLALRRYHFMESSDWADLFTASLLKHKWDICEPCRRTRQVQSLLNQALRKSSCENDTYRQRLFIYSTEQRYMPLSTNAIGSFNFIQLGYRVGWPLSIVLHPEALKIYSDIFSFLMQVRSALFTLTDVWHSLKAFTNRGDWREHFTANCSKSFSTFVKLRLQVNHFVTTLHQYVQFQLSDVSWCKFFHSLRHQVKDMLDLESVHTSYLSDALHICFLSVETQSISSTIRNILQCALDIKSCLTMTDVVASSDGLPHSPGVLAGLKISQILAIKDTFETNLNNLYLCYLKSPKHGEFEKHGIDSSSRIDVLTLLNSKDVILRLLLAHQHVSFPVFYLCSLLLTRMQESRAVAVTVLRHLGFGRRPSEVELHLPVGECIFSEFVKNLKLPFVTIMHSMYHDLTQTASVYI